MHARHIYVYAHMCVHHCTPLSKQYAHDLCYAIICYSTISNWENWGWPPPPPKLCKLGVAAPPTQTLHAGGGRPLHRNFVQARGGRPPQSGGGHGNPEVAIEGPPAKRAKGPQDDWMTALTALEPVARNLLGAAALDWLVGHVDMLVACASWQDLQPRPFTEAARAMIVNIAEVQLVEAEEGQDEDMERADVEHDQEMKEMEKEEDEKIKDKGEKKEEEKEEEPPEEEAEEEPQEKKEEHIDERRQEQPWYYMFFIAYF